MHGDKVVVDQRQTIRVNVIVLEMKWGASSNRSQ